MGLQDALELLQFHHKILKMLPASRTSVLCLTSKTMRIAVENAKADAVVVRRRCVKYKLKCSNAWCKVTMLNLNECELGEGGARAIAVALRECVVYWYSIQ
jgi:hypothetical protein